MEYRMELTAALDGVGVEQMLRVLRRVAGVRTVEAHAGSAQVHVRYDTDLTSPQEIGSAVARSGFLLRQAAPRAGGCCGSCGGH